jgi:hypothetical protein
MAQEDSFDSKSLIKFIHSKIVFLYIGKVTSTIRKPSNLDISYKKCESWRKISSLPAISIITVSN